MRFRILHIILLLLTVLLTACTDELPYTEPTEVGDGKVAVDFSFNVAEAQTVMTRAFDDDMSTATQWAKLRVFLVVFDRNGFWVETAQAEKKAAGTDEVTFTAVLTPSDEPRIVHFIATTDTTFTKASLEQTGAHESSMMASPTVTADIYWQRVLLNSIKATTRHKYNGDYYDGVIDPADAFTKVPLVRNFAQIEIVNSAADKDVDDGKFTITGYCLYHVPVAGTYAPLNTRNGGEFVTYYKETSTGVYEPKKYADFLDENYQGVGVSPSEDSNYKTRDLIDIPDKSKIPASYVFESPNATGSYKGKTFLVVRGYMGNDSTDERYHKIDLIYYADAKGKPTIVDAEKVEVKYYNILRNMKYKVDIESVTGGGYSSADAAASHASSNNVYASIETEDVTNIGDAKQRLYVEKTYVLCTTPKKDTEVKVGYKYLSTTKDTWKNSAVTVTADNGSCADLTYTGKNDTETSEHWSYATLKLKEDLTESQTVTLHFRVVNGTEIVSRDVTVLFCEPYKLQVKCLNPLDSTNVVSAAVGQGVEVDLYIPKGLPEQIFPLSFSLEPEDKTIYPSVVDDTSIGVKANNLPVSSGTSIIPGGSAKSFVYTKVLTHADYANYSSGYVENAGEDGVRVRCYFKTNCADNETTVYACNEYFSPNLNDLANNPTGTPAFDYFLNSASSGVLRNVTLTGGQYYGKGNTVNLNISVFDKTVPLTITITEEGASETTTIPWVSGTTSYSYKTQTFGGKITAKVSVTSDSSQYKEVSQSRTTLKQPIKFTATGDGLSKDYSYSSGGGWDSITYSYSKSNQTVTIKNSSGTTIGSGTISTSGFVGDAVVGEGLSESDTVTLQYSFTPTYTWQDYWTYYGTTQTRSVSTTISNLTSGTATLKFSK